MERDFVSEMNFENVNNYNKPFVITFISMPGSGKTDIARTLSQELKVFLLSNDYIRNYYYQLTKDYSEEKRLEIQDKVDNINKERLNKLISNKISFVYDKCFNNEDDYNKLYDILGDNYNVIKIKINSDDVDNIDRIKDTVMDYNKVYEGVIGDNVEYLSSYPEDVYYQIKERIPVLLKDFYADYLINDKNDEQLIINKIKEDIMDSN